VLRLPVPREQSLGEELLEAVARGLDGIALESAVAVIAQVRLEVGKADLAFAGIEALPPDDQVVEREPVIRARPVPRPIEVALAEPIPFAVIVPGSPRGVWKLGRTKTCSTSDV